MRSSILCLLVVITVGLGFATPAVAQRGPSGPNYRAGEVLLRVAPGANVKALAKAYRLTEPGGGADQRDLRPFYRLLIADGSTPEVKAAQLSADPQVIYAEPNFLVQSPEARQRSSWAVGGPNDSFEGQWAAVKVRFPEAHAITRGAGTRVAVLDTGIDAAHPAFAGRLAPGYDFVDNDDDPADAEGGAAFGHGTHVAGLIALAAPDTTIIPLRTLDPTGFGTIWNQLRALSFAAERNATVVNVSWSFEGRSRLLADAIADASCTRQLRRTCRGGAIAGAAVVAAAGNSGTRALEYPAADAMPGLLAVAATTEEDNLASFTTFGPWVQIGAPGDRILSTFPGGGYAIWSGSSMAAPLSAGTVALIRAVNPRLTPDQSITRLLDTSTPILATVKRRLDAAAALGVAMTAP